MRIRIHPERLFIVGIPLLAVGLLFSLPAACQEGMGGAGGGGGGAGAGAGGAAAGGSGDAPDLLFFQERIEPVIKTTCAQAGCHGGSNAGNLRFASPDFFGNYTADQSRENYKAALRYVRYKNAATSMFLLKALAQEDGGLEHGGAMYNFDKKSKEYEDWVGWINGKSAADLPPVADAGVPARLKRGSTVKLDGSASSDRRGGKLTYRWTFESRPQGSSAALSDPASPQPTFVADQDGAYTLSLVVSNGKLDSAPDTTTLRVDSVPVVVLEAEDSELASPFEKVPDQSASGGAFVAASEGDLDAASATWKFQVPAEGRYALWARVYVPPGSPATCVVSVDGGRDMPWQFGDASGWTLEQLQDRTSARRNLYGQWAIQNGGLACTSLGEGGFGAFSTGVSLAAGAAEATFHCPKGPGKAQNAFLLFDIRSPREFKYVGFLAGAGKLIVGKAPGQGGRGGPGGGGGGGAGGPGGGAGARGMGEPAATFDVKVDPVRGVKLRIELAGRKVKCFADGAPVGEHAFRDAFSGELGFATRGGSPQVNDFLVTKGEEVLFRDDFKANPPSAVGGVSLKPGPHTLKLKPKSASLNLDQVLLVKTNTESRIDLPTRRFVRRLYFDCIGRGPTELELTLAAAQTREEFVDSILRSYDFFENWYESELFYFLLLDLFRPSTPQITSIPSRLQNRQINVKDALQDLVISQYFNSRNPGNDTFVTVVLEQLLGMKVQEKENVQTLETGKKMYDGYELSLFGVKGKSQSDVVKIVMNQPGFYEKYLGRYHKTLTGRDLDKTALTAAAADFRADPGRFPDIVKGWLLSKEYEAGLGFLRPKSDATFIRTLYTDLLGRQPAYKELRDVRNALLSLADSQPLRSVFGRIVIESNLVNPPDKAKIQKEAWLTQQFLKFLGREPLPAEVSAFGEALADPACTTKTILQAIVTSPEYQNY
ncbi:MAG: hypothetical protein HYZ53_16460 [Planctomycetes bacterium]|nr:hypothetical protein [Planctomycetota bacterium]